MMVPENIFLHGYSCLKSSGTCFLIQKQDDVFSRKRYTKNCSWKSIVFKTKINTRCSLCLYFMFLVLVHVIRREREREERAPKLRLAVKSKALGVCERWCLGKKESAWNLWRNTLLPQCIEHCGLMWDVKALGRSAKFNFPDFAR